MMVNMRHLYYIYHKYFPFNHINLLRLRKLFLVQKLIYIYNCYSIHILSLCIMCKNFTSLTFYCMLKSEYWIWIIIYKFYDLRYLCMIVADLGGPFFTGGPELWPHPLAYAAELPGTALQHATLVHPALHPQVPVRSYLWLSGDKQESVADAPYHHVMSIQTTRERERERETPTCTQEFLFWFPCMIPLLYQSQMFLLLGYIAKLHLFFQKSSPVDWQLACLFRSYPDTVWMHIASKYIFKYV